MLAKWLVQTIIWLGIIAILLFVPAGTVNWSGAWIFLVEALLVSLVLGLWLARHDPALLKERLRPPIQKGAVNPGQDYYRIVGVALSRLVRLHGTRCRSFQMVCGPRLACGSRGARCPSGV